MAHDYAVYAAIAGVVGITALALVLGVADGLVAASITALTTLAGVKVALARGKDNSSTGGGPE